MSNNPTSAVTPCSPANGRDGHRRLAAVPRPRKRPDSGDHSTSVRQKRKSRWRICRELMRSENMTPSIRRLPKFVGTEPVRESNSPNEFRETTNGKTQNLRSVSSLATFLPTFLTHTHTQRLSSFDAPNLRSRRVRVAPQHEAVLSSHPHSPDPFQLCRAFGLNTPLESLPPHSGLDSSNLAHNSRQNCLPPLSPDRSRPHSPAAISLPSL